MFASDDDSRPGFVLDIWMNVYTERLEQRATHRVSLLRGYCGFPQHATRTWMVQTSQRMEAAHRGEVVRPFL